LQYAGYLISNYTSDQSILVQINLIWTTMALLAGVWNDRRFNRIKFKRIGCKDSGKIMPGHGGILDRLDSVIFVAPIVFLFYQILNYVS
jgi:phosphatidate cytidylyltransferase